MGDVQRLAGNPSISCYLIETVYRIVSLKYITLLFTIPNMFEWIHTEGGAKKILNAKKESHVLPSGQHFVLSSVTKP
jgi:hypothetical protein